MKELETVFREAQEDLEAAKNTRADEVVILRRDNPELLAGQIEKAFGFEYVE